MTRPSTSEASNSTAHRLLAGPAPLSADDLQRRRAGFTVVAALVAAAINASVVVQFVRFGELGMAVYMASAGVLYLGTVVPYRLGHYRITPIYLTLVALVAVSLANILFLDRQAGDYYFLLLVAALTPLAVHSKDRPVGIAITAAAILVFAAAEVLEWQRPFAVPIDAVQSARYRSSTSVLSVMFLAAMVIYFDGRLRAAQEEGRRLYVRSDGLLRNILPDSIVERLESHEGHIAERHSDVTILFADIVGFTPLAQSVSPEALVEILDHMFTGFDALAERHGLEKIKTIGDAYMVAGGLPVAKSDHVQAVARMALDMRTAVEGMSVVLDRPLDVRIGIHTGDVVAGVIGRKKLAYDLWGDTVNTAARMESHGIAGEIQVTSEVRDLLRDDFVFEPRGRIEVKGKGSMECWLLRGGRSAEPAAASASAA